MRIKNIILSFLVGAQIFSCNNFTLAQTFVNIAPQLGINHTVNTQLQFGGHGCAFFDFDNDGWDDITFIQETDSVVLYRNNEGVFESIPSVAFQIGQIRQALWVDYDNDSDYDLFMTSTNGNSRLYNNDGNFNFTDVTVFAGISTAIANNFGVTFGDYDLDGYLDFYLARYQMSGDLNNPAHLNALYRNNGNGTFTDMTVLAGVADSIQPSFMGAWIDIDRNGLPDLYVINDRTLWGNSMYLNNGDGTFTDITSICGAEMFGQDPMGITYGDYDNDGDLDMLLSNGGPPTKPPRLYTNNGNSYFVENAGPMGISVPVTFMCTWGGTWIDIDNNSFQDLYLTTGLLMPANGEVRNYLFRSNSAQSFTDSPQLFTGNHIAASYSVARGDIDNDGCADMIVQNAKNYNSFIWKNEYGPTLGNNYIKITLEGTLSNTMAIGSWITVYCQGNTYTHYTRCGESFISQDSQHHIFGLGNFQVVDSIVVDYPSGVSDVYYNLPVNQHIYLTEAETSNFALINPANSFFICSSSNVSLTAPSFSTYLWSTGETTQSINITQSGSYYVTAWDSNGFPHTSDTLTFTVLPSPYVLHQVQHNLCFGDENGAVQLTVFNANPNYEISWSNGATGLTQSNLVSGVYSYSYLDEFGCTYSDEFTLNSGDEILLFSETSNQTTFESGSLQLMVIGGTPPIQILVNGNSMPTNPMDVDSGVYIVTVSDANGCIYEEVITIGFVDMSSVFEFDLNNPFFYPNPLSDRVLHLKGITSEHVVDVRDALGRQVQYSNCVSNSCLEFINISAGAIFITVRVEDYIYVFKVIVLE